MIEGEIWTTRNEHATVADHSSRTEPQDFVNGHPRPELSKNVFHRKPCFLEDGLTEHYAHLAQHVTES